MGLLRRVGREALRAEERSGEGTKGRRRERSQSGVKGVVAREGSKKGATRLKSACVLSRRRHGRDAGSGWWLRASRRKSGDGGEAFLSSAPAAWGCSGEGMREAAREEMDVLVEGGRERWRATRAQSVGRQQEARGRRWRG